MVAVTVSIVYLQQKKTSPKKTSLTEFCFHELQPIPPDVELVITQISPPSSQPNLSLNISRQCAQTLEIEIKAKAPTKTYLTEKLILSGSEKKQKHPIVFKIDPKALNQQDVEEKDQKSIKGNDKDLNKKDKIDKKTQPSIKKIKTTESEDRVEDQDQPQTIPTKKEIQLTPKKSIEKSIEKTPEKSPEKAPEPPPEKSPEVLPF